MSSPARAVRSFALRLVTATADAVVRPPTPRRAPTRTEPAPILVIAPPTGGFARYYAEILANEGFTGTDVVASHDIDADALVGRAVVIVGDVTPSAGLLALLSAWLEDGGTVVAMRPAANLGPLLGLRRASGVIGDGYVAIDTSCPPGAGIVDRPVQFHGEADRWELDGATEVARLDDGSPAVTVRPVGDRGGWAAAFTFDLARSVVLTRQGNPAWAGQNRDGDLVIRTDDLFFGAAADDPQPDWVDPELLDVPQADELQRLLANVIHLATSSSVPLPRFWYLPHGKRAAVVMTGDDHGDGGTVGRFERYAALDRPGASTEDWETVRATSYLLASGPYLPWRKLVRLRRAGFEIALHVDTWNEDWTVETLRRFYDHQLQWFRNRSPFAGPPRTVRTHCVAWSDYVSQVHLEREHGIRLDTNYYFYPAPWVRGRGGYFTGSALPMRFADLDGTPLDVYQAATQITDESAQELPGAIETMLDAALGPDAFIAVITVQAHTDREASGVSDSVVAAATTRGVPVIAAQQLLTWLDARNASLVERLERVGDDLTFTVRADPLARGLQLRIPMDRNSWIDDIHVDGAAVPFTTEQFKGVWFARVEARTGSYLVRLGATPPAPMAKEPVVQTTRPAICHVGLQAFLAGACDGVVVSPWNGGELVLEPALHAVGEIPSALPCPPVAVEGAVRFLGGGVQRFGVGIADVAGAAFELDPKGRLGAVTWSGSARSRTEIAGDWIDELHRYRIDREGDSVRFWIDGRDVALPQVQLPEHPMVVAEADGVRDELDVAWLRVLPYGASGQYTSPTVDGGAGAVWSTLRWTVVHAQATRLDVAVRAGESPHRSADWTPWCPVPYAGAELDLAGRYLQYRLTLTSERPVRTPVVRAVELYRSS